MTAPIYGSTNPAPDTPAGKTALRTYAMMIELNLEKETLYRELHADVWPEVHAAIKRAHIANYHIYVTELAGRKYLVAHLDYTGDDPAKDFGSIANDTTTRDKWWPLTASCQHILAGTPEGQVWKPLERVMFIP
ncbi:MAG TPA: L-rhamnose mutarotase [Rariglobus sp.]|jgi:L-rhamnose mutarotase|nr:L-rhamnose mutarotase [Rariglobus sp.]